MDTLSLVVTVVVGIVTLIVLYVLYMSRKFLTFKRLGIPALTPLPVIGNFRPVGKVGIFQFHKNLYRQYATEKVYGYYEGPRPILIVKDLDMLRDILVKNFNNFCNRRRFASQEPFTHSLTQIIDDHWHRVRNTVSPTFSSGKLKKMFLQLEENAKDLTSHLRESCKSGKEIELKDVMSCYTMDAIASTGFGVKTDSFNNKSNKFAEEAKNLMNFGDKAIALILLFPFVVKFLSKIGMGLLPRDSLKFFCSFVDAAMENRKQGDGTKKRNDFIQLVVDAKFEDGDEGKTGNGNMSETDPKERKGLSYLDIQGQALIFILAGFDTTATVLSFTLYCMAHNPEICAKVQEEIDSVLDGKFPTYESMAEMTYLDMCLNESMRMYPPGFIFDRVCKEDCEIQGIKIPKDMVVLVPAIAIHNDPELYPNPEKFDPERFTPENKANRHPFAFLPFGQGPRNCIGMRLALMEVKIALAAILQEMTPVPSSKSSYPPELTKFLLKSVDGLWVKMVSRKEERT